MKLAVKRGEGEGMLPPSLQPLTLPALRASLPLPRWER